MPSPTDKPLPPSVAEAVKAVGAEVGALIRRTVEPTVKRGVYDDEAKAMVTAVVATVVAQTITGSLLTAYIISEPGEYNAAIEMVDQAAKAGFVLGLKNAVKVAQDVTAQHRATPG